MSTRIDANGVVERMFEQDGKLHVARSMSGIENLFAENKRDADLLNGVGGKDMRLLGRIDMVTAEQWSRECGAAIGSKEFAQYCKRKIMSGDFAKFRIQGD